MTRFSKLDVECAIPLAVRRQLTLVEMDAILEVAYLSIIADGLLDEEEADAFVRSMLRLYGDQASPERIHSVMKRFTARLERGETCEGARCARSAELGGSLRRPIAREQAYKLAYVMAMSDLRTNDAEFAFDQALRGTLGISEERAEALADEAAAAVLGNPLHEPGEAPSCAGDVPPAARAKPAKRPPAVRAPAAKRPAAARAKPGKKRAAPAPRRAAGRKAAKR